MELSNYKILDQKTIIINRSETNFDKACDIAYDRAISAFDIDECGHSSKLTDWRRSNSWVEVEFKSFVSTGSNCIYTFEAIAKSNIEDEE